MRTSKCSLSSLARLYDPFSVRVFDKTGSDRREYYLTSAGWVGDDNTMVAAVWMRRAQNLSIVSVCSPPNWTCIEVRPAPRTPL